MAKNGSNINGSKADAAAATVVKPGTLQKAFELQRLGNRAVKKAQEENRRHGIPNWYSIGGVIVSDQELIQNNKEQKQK